jgi:hypothetical protein
MTPFEQGYYLFMKLAEEGMIDEETAGYLPSSPHADENCGNCRHFQKNGSCDLVLGRISEYGWCRKFSLKAAEAVPA